MLITRTSSASGKTRTLDLNITQEQMAAYERGTLVQHAFPNLRKEDREFIVSGTTHEEWKAIMKNPPRWHVDMSSDMPKIG